jgi:probable F420-dependent oxidoreductase
MKTGFGLPVSGSWATAANVLQVARRAEELGYHSLWTFQRLLCDVAGKWGEAYRSVHDPLTTLAYVAAATSRIRLGVAVVNLPFISPVLLAKQGATVDILSGGRLDLGLGLGWADEEYQASGVTTDGLGRRAEEFLTVLKTLWTAEVVAHEGEFYRIPRTSMAPKPVQSPHPPILLGGAAPPALRRAGRRADGWISSSRADLANVGPAIDQVRQAASSVGHDPAALRLICRGSVRIRDDAAQPAAPPAEGGSDRPRRLLTGSVDQIRADIAALAQAGFTEVFIDLNFDPDLGSPDADPAESMRRAEQALVAFAPTA